MSSERNDTHFEKSPQMAGVEPGNIASSEADIPLPYLAGEGMGALHWISPIYGARAVPIKNQPAGKK